MPPATPCAPRQPGTRRLGADGRLRTRPCAAGDARVRTPPRNGGSRRVVLRRTDSTVQRRSPACGAEGAGADARRHGGAQRDTATPRHRDTPPPPTGPASTARRAPGALLRYHADRREPLVLLVVATLALVVSGIAPRDRLTWWLEVAPVLIGAPLLDRDRTTLPADAAAVPPRFRARAHPDGRWPLHVRRGAAGVLDAGVVRLARATTTIASATSRRASSRPSSPVSCSSGRHPSCAAGGYSCSSSASAWRSARSTN